MCLVIIQQVVIIAFSRNQLDLLNDKTIRKRQFHCRKLHIKLLNEPRSGKVEPLGNLFHHSLLNMIHQNEV